MFRDVIKEEFNRCYTGGSGGIRRNSLEGSSGGCNQAAFRAVEADESYFQSTSEEFQQTQKNLGTLEKERKPIIHEIGKLKKTRVQANQREGRSEGIGEESVG